METPRKKAIESVRDSRENERRQSQHELLIEQQRHENRNQRHPKDGQQIWQGDEARGHRGILDFGLQISNWYVRPHKQTFQDSRRRNHAAWRSSRTEISGGQP